MSGPKVVRIVTREEAIAICEGHLARVDAAIAEWTRIGSRNETVSEADIAAVTARRAALARMLEADRFIDLQKQAPAEIAFLRSDTATRLDAAAERMASARRSQRRLVQAAAAVAVRLTAAGLAVPPELGLATVDEAGAAAIERAIARALDDLAAVAAAGTGNGAASAEARKLAAALAGGERARSFDAWIAEQAPAADDAALLRIDRHLGELRAAGEDDTAVRFEARAAALDREAGARRALLADSLAIDLADAVRAARRRAAARMAIAELSAELAGFSGEAVRALLAEADRTMAARESAAIDSAAMEALAPRMAAAIETERSALAAAARRRAVLEGLAGLGYEVTEGMATAWVEDGRVVLRKAADRSYGVEIGGGASAGRLQVRTVAFGAPGAARDASRDRDRETLWCEEFSRLQDLVADEGGEIVIERALAAGAMPLPVIEDAALADTGVADIAAPLKLQRPMPR